MNDFDYDVMQKKRIARNAKYQKNGSKSRKCTLPSDYLTEAQKRKLNGAIMTYKISKPITWEEFKTYPVGVQVESWRYFSDNHGCTNAMMAKMYGCTANAVSSYAYTVRPELRGILRGHADKAVKKAFAEWLKAERVEAVETAQSEAEAVEGTVKVEPDKKSLPEMPYVNTIQAGTFKATGRAMDIGRTLYRMFQDVEIRAVISFEVIGTDGG